MARAKELGLSHLAITDHGTTAGHREFQRDAKAAGITPILGIEAYITPDRFDRRTAAKRQDGTGIYNHITLLAKNEVGLKNIEHMSKIAWTEGFFHKPRIDIELLKEHHDGIIALSGCMSGMIAKPLLNGFEDKAHEYAQQLFEILGDRFFIEVMESNSAELNNSLIEIGNKYGIKPVMTSDCHMANKSDLPLAEAMLIINTKPKTLKDFDLSKAAKMDILDALNYLYPRFDKDGNEVRMSFSKFELWLHTYEEHVANLEKQNIGPEAVDNTALIADQIEDYPYFENLDTLPEFEGTDDAMKTLREKTYAGLKKRGIDTKENRDRVDMELDVIEKKDLPDYFLIETDFVEYAAANDILVGYGRGSAVSYLTNYALGITKINPMPYDLLPERFLSLERSDPADIDTDFAIDGRYQVKAYAQSKYANVSNIATVGYYKDKSAIKAAATLFKASFSETTKLTNMITSIEEFTAHEDARNYHKKFPHVVELARRLNGRIQNFGLHAGGIILSKEPIEYHAPVQTANDPSDPAAGRVPVAALDMRELADMGYIKYDLLGLRTLSIVDDAIKLIEKRHGIKIDIEEIPLDDKNLYDMISAGKTSGLFQAEASASTKTILDMGGVSNFAELVASNALVRPGAANSTVGETYITGKKTGKVSYIHPDMKAVTKETYGAVLYQEQQLLLCQRIAGMSEGDANKVRKAVSKKIPEDLAVWKDQFIAGATEKIGARKAEKVWKDLEASADYAFAKAHAVGYSMLTLLTAYLKYYYPLEFFVSALNRMKTSNKSDRMKMLKYFIEAKSLGIRVRLPHVNASGIDIEIATDDKGDYIRMGLSQIKGIGAKTAPKVLNNAPYNSYAEMMEQQPSKTIVNALNAVGAAAFEDNPRTGKEMENFFAYLSLPTFDTKNIPPRMYAQFRPLTHYADNDTFVCMGIVGGDKKKPGWRLIEIVDDTASASAFVPEHCDIEVGQVYVFLISNNSVVKWITTDVIANDAGGQFQEFLEATRLQLPEDHVKVVSFNPRTTKGGKRMASMVIADEDKDMISVLVWPTQFAEAYTKCKEGSVVKMAIAELEDGGYALDSFVKENHEFTR